MDLLPDLPPPLQTALNRLADHPRVAGALLIGSLSAGTLSPTSDYDLVLIIDDLEPLWYVAAAPLGGLWPPGWSGENLEPPPLRVRDLLGDAT